MHPAATTRVFALLGDPVAHSLSPRFQNAAFAAAAHDAVYVALRCREPHLRALMRALAEAGGGGNVTVPHKRAAASELDTATDAVRRTGACNTFWGAGAALHGDNTDVAGFAAAVAQLVGSVTDARVLLLGAGGAAAAALCALVDGGAAHVEIRNRSAARAAALARRFEGEGTRIVTDPANDSSYDLIVNATSLGLRDDDPLPLAVATDSPPLLDVVSRPGGTAWVRRARELGVRADDGLTMLLAQGAAAYERWFGAPPPEGVMHAAVTRVDRPRDSRATAEDAADPVRRR